MSVDEVVKYFGSTYKAADALKISARNFQAWRRKGKISLVQQFRLEKLTNGVLKADEE